MDRINWVTSDSFNAIGQLARVRDHEATDCALVHARMQAFLQALVKRAREAGFSEQDTRLTLYALTALADEVAMASAGALREHWSTRPLQLVLFGENVAGERFFDHLESIRGESTRVDVLRVYYLCLLFGFRGRYGVRGAEVPLTDLVDGVRIELGRMLSLPEALSPNGARPEQGLLGAASGLPVHSGRLALVVLGVVALVVVLHAGLSAALDEQLLQLVACARQGSTG